VLGGLSTARLLEVGLFERLESVSYDLRVRAASGRGDSSVTNLGFVYVDDATISAIQHGLLGQPGYGLHWPRHVYGRLVEQLAAEGAQTVAFDVLLGELRPDLHGIIRDGRVIDSDDFLAEQLRATGRVVLACEAGLIPPDLFRSNAAALADITTDKDSDGILRRVRAFRDYRLWHPAFRAVEADSDYGVDLAKARVEADAVVLPRPAGEAIRIPLDEQGRFALADFYGEALPDGVPERALPFDTLRVWHMGVILAARELGLDLQSAKVDLAGGCIRLQGPDCQRFIPVDHEGRFYIDWSIPVNHAALRQEPAVNVFQRSVASQEERLDRLPAHWNGKHLIIGSTATGNDLSDMGATPLDKNTFLVSKHWNIAGAIVADRFIRRGTALQETVLLLGFGLLAGALALWLRSTLAVALLAFGGAAYLFVAFYLYTHARLWLPLVLPLTAATSLYLVVTTWRVVFEQGERRRVKSVFSKVVSPNVVSELLQARQLSLGGARREITVFFADVRGFTALTDNAQQAVADEVARLGLKGEDAKALYDRQAKETLDTVNLYLSVVADAVKQHRGTLDKYIGDCVMAFWGAPTPNPRHALACVRAAIEAQRAIDRLNRERSEFNAIRPTTEPVLPLLSLGTGINTGLVTVGLMGSDAHILNYTVFGREVNVASRLEGVSGQGRIIISEATFQHLKRDDPALAACCVPLPAVAVKGIRDELKIFEVPWRETNNPGTPTGARS
jgi:class 3 adenylate cyclase/CHASE2 domain-containing sensor protein